MKRIITFGLFIAFGFTSVAQEENEKLTDPNWKLKALTGLNLTQATFTNWAAGGRNNISGLAFADASANYSKDRIKWDNRLKLALGGIQYFEDNLQKTDDQIDFQSSFGYGLKKTWYITALAGFRTQFLDGFSFPNDSIRNSAFMAPGYLNLSSGIEFAPNDNFNVFFSPISSKFTFVQDENLANAGAFGVAPAILDDMNAIVTPGEQFRYELGAYARILYNKELMENVNMKSSIELFSNYVNNPQNIDINAELIISMKVNKWLSASIQANLIYDHDITIRNPDIDGDIGGPRTQFKQVIGVGLAYTMKNYREKKK